MATTTERPGNRAIHVSDVTALNTNTVGTFVTYFPRASLRAYDIDHLAALSEALYAIGFDAADPIPTGTFNGSDTYRHEFYRGSEWIVVTDYMKSIGASTNNWCHIKIRGKGTLAVDVRNFINEYNTRIEANQT